MSNKVVIEIEIDLETLANAADARSMGILQQARRQIVEVVIDALTPEDKIRLEKYQKGDDK